MSDILQFYNINSRGFKPPKSPPDPVMFYTPVCM